MRWGLSWQRLLFLAVGLGLFWLALREVELPEVWRQLGALGPLGAVAVIALYLVIFGLDTGAWRLTIPGARGGLGWFYALGKARMVGEAFNLIVPAATFGGEPVKAVILKRHHGIGYAEGSASVILQRTVVLLSMILFFAIGVAIMLADGRLPRAQELLATAGWSVLSLGVLGFFAVQRWAVASRVARLFGRWSGSRGLIGLLRQIEAVERHFHDFYARRPAAFAAAFAATFLAWLLAAAEVKLVLFFLGQHITWAEAWMLASLVELLRAGFFFIPAGLGAMEVGFVVLVQALTGDPALGLAVALVRRGREIFFIAWGLAIGWLDPPLAERAGRAASPEV